MAVTEITLCITKWLYAVDSAVLKALRALLEGLLVAIDAQILQVRAVIAQYDPARLAEQYTWGVYEALINKLKSSMMSGFQNIGPGADICPDFYHYLVDPQLALLESSLDSFSIYKDRYFSMVSYLDNLDRLLVSWELAKDQISATLDILDDALYNALINESVS